MTYQDITRLKQQMPELDIVSPMLTLWGKTATFRDKKATCSFKGLLPNYTKIEEPVMYYGRYINDMDIAQGRKVCVLGKKIY
jgi:putative ABC transport system permease protein